MVRTIVVLSGPVCAGKSTLAKRLTDIYSAHGIIHVKTHEVLQALDPSIENSREALQTFGERQDRKTKGAWVRAALDKIIHGGSGESVLVVDAARIPDQVEAIRDAYGRRVVHIHLTAPISELESRYSTRTSTTLKEFSSYDDVRQDATEAKVGDLAKLADAVIDSQMCTADDVLVRVASRIGLYGKGLPRLVDVLVGGQYGSEGKGQVAAFLASEYDLLVRVGGPNAGHTVFRSPEPYTFHHLPSGTFASKARLVIGPGAVLDAEKLLKEIAECSVDFERLSIDPQAMTISDVDKSTASSNRFRPPDRVLVKQRLVRFVKEGARQSCWRRMSKN